MTLAVAAALGATHDTSTLTSMLDAIDFTTSIFLPTTVVAGVLPLALGLF